MFTKSPSRSAKECVTGVHVASRSYRGARYVYRSCKYSATRALSQLEQRWMSRHPCPRYAPVFIIGAPRSGTTLLYQVLTRGLRLAYFSNLAAKFPYSPGTVAMLTSYLRNVTPPASYESSYGETNHWNAANQGRKIWLRWFHPDQSYTGSDDVNEDDKKEMQGAVGLTEQAFLSPFLNKSQGHCVRILPLVDAFPNALFIRLRRDLVSTAKSILVGRETYFGSRDHWFSVRPSNYYRIKNGTPIVQVCEQLHGLCEDMNRDLAMVGKTRVMEVSYDELCNNPKDIIRLVADFYQQQTKLEMQPRFNVPDSFNKSFGPKMDPQDVVVIKENIARLWPSAGP